MTQAKAALAQAQAQLADLQVGKRPEEIAVLEATLRSAKAQAADAARTLARTQDLLKRGVATQAQYDDAATQAEVADAAIGQATANLAVGNLPARPETIKAAENQVKQARTALDQAEWRFPSVRLSRLRQAASMTSSVMPATPPAQRAGAFGPAGRCGEAHRLRA